MGSAVRPAEPLGSIPKRKEGQTSIARRRANSSLSDLSGIPIEPRLQQSHSTTHQQLVGTDQQFDATVRNLIDDKYNKEYKLDR